MKFVHIADTHIRGLKYHEEYRQVFSKIYSHLREINPDFIIHSGDLFHGKISLSSEYVDLASEFLETLASISPAYIILGNHDGLVNNSNRQDAVSPIVNNLKNRNLFLLKNSGETDIGNNFVLNSFAVNFCCIGLTIF